MRKKSSLNQWLRSGVVKQNIKNTLDSTLDTLYQLCQLNVTRESISRSLKDILRTDLTFRQEQQEHSKIYNWFQERQKKPTPISIFKKTRIFSSAIGSHSTINIASSPNNITSSPNNVAGSSNNVAGSPNYIASTRDSSPPPIKRRYSFSEAEQGAVVETFLTLAEKAIYNFLVKYEDKLPDILVENFASKQNPPVSKDFRDADVLCMLKFIIENIKIFLKESAFHGSHKSKPIELLKDFKKDVRHKNAHGIVENNKGRWCDLSLQRVVHLTCEVVTCLGSDYKEVYAAKEKFDDEILKRWSSRAASDISNQAPSSDFFTNLRNGSDTTSLNNETSNQFRACPLKRKLDDTDFDQMTDFVLGVFKKIKENKTGEKQKILQLSLEKNESLIKIWRMAIIKRTYTEQINKFVLFSNSMFNMNLSFNTEDADHDSDSEKVV
ncbi:unnamed protein product [Rhizophagus irregularis]|nr:unnamed protein product [Rhizophagus irregularis]